MKKTLLAAIIAATALVPPAALAQDRGRWGGNRERVQNNENAGGGAFREGRGDRGAGSWRAQPQAQPAQAQPQQQRSWGGGDRGNRGGDSGQRSWNRGGGDGQRGSWRQQPQAQQPAQPAQPSQSAQQWQNRGDRGQWNRGNRGGQWNNGQQAQQRPQPQPQWRGNRGDNRGWSGNNNRGWNDRNNGGWNNNRYDNRDRWNNGWRSNNRYDWRGYRSSNRSAYRLPRYYAPSGWGYGYRRFSIGYTLSSILFSSQYWINDPFYYRLPEVYGPYRWVRYYNDALLVDIYTGEVVDTVYDIFW